jgi:hypothetical protein
MPTGSSTRRGMAEAAQGRMWAWYETGARASAGVVSPCSLTGRRLAVSLGLQDGRLSLAGAVRESVGGEQRLGELSVLLVAHREQRPAATTFSTRRLSSALAIRESLRRQGTDAWRAHPPRPRGHCLAA